MIETIIDKGTTKQGTYEKARVAKCTAKYGVLCTILRFAEISPDHSLKEGTVQGWENRCNREVPTAADHASL